ncbi:Ger(x)C family spore germination protein [Clostridium sp. CF012]|uniref:Ger(x)C family spore germination protein n=1 Tax=Clostridium sp. CF012 TaxID=2843319 RepID=UPI001C0CE7F8|nr:Ger(x)C family spore germination protein [Clostridium sp. CF012]MBU3142969.1 Ger(x)C family spore germination protein [Clostridium sp. CF012]
MKKKFSFIIVLIFSTILLTGCWDSIELNEKEIISAIGIDKADEKGKIIVSFQSIITERISTAVKPGSDKSNVHLVLITANSISDSLVKYNARISKIPEFDHTSIYILGEDIAREGVNSFIDGIFRNYEFRAKSDIMVCKGKASDILRKKIETTNLSADFIINLLDRGNHMETVPRESLHTFMLKLSSKTTSPVITQIEIKENNELEGGDIGYGGCGIFKKDKLVGYLNSDETMGLLWLTTKMNRLILASGYPGTVSENLSQQILNSKIKIRPKIINGEIMMSLDIWEHGNIRENNKGIGINSPETIKILEDGFANEIKRQVEGTLKKLQKEYKTDSLGFGEIIHKKFPKHWKKIESKWDEIYPTIKVEVNVKVTLKSTGKIINSTTH